jgi:LacI family transcriptional regulator
LPYKTTIQDIAKELNLTSATISRALHNNPRISEQTKKLVLDTARRMDYRRNKIASSLRSGKSHTIGVIIPSAQMNFFGSVVHGIQTMANTCGYSILLYQSEESTELEIKAIEAFLGAWHTGIHCKRHN